MAQSPPPSPNGSRRLQAVRRPLESLSVPGYRPFWVSSLLGYGASQMTILARPWIAYELSGSALALGITVASSALPSLLLAPLAGAIGDRGGMRTIMVVTSLLMGVVAFLTAVDAWTGYIQWWHVAILSGAQGVVNAFDNPTRLAIVHRLVARSQVMNALSLNTLALNMTRMTGPLIAGVAIARIDAAAAFALIGGAHLAAGFAIALVPVSGPATATARRSMLQDISEGFTYALRDRTIFKLLAIGLVASVFGQPFQHLLPLFQDVLSIGPVGLGLLISFMGIGAFAGSVTSASLGDFQHKGALLVAFMVVLGGSIILFSVSSVYAVSLLLMVPLGFSHSGRTIVHQATLHAYSDEAMRGRVMALAAMQQGVMPLAVLPMTAVADWAGAPVAVGAAGAVMLVYGAWELLGSKTVRRLA